MNADITNMILSMLKVPVFAFIVLAATLAIIMSLERILGRPIPNLRGSCPVRRNRAFAFVLVCMAASLCLVLPLILQVSVCSDCDYPFAWHHPLVIAEFSIMALAFSGVIGWIVFAALSIVSASSRIIRHYISN
jgi:hypothetical protein